MVIGKIFDMIGSVGDYLQGKSDRFTWDSVMLDDLRGKLEETYTKALGQEYSGNCVECIKGVRPSSNGRMKRYDLVLCFTKDTGDELVIAGGSGYMKNGSFKLRFKPDDVQITNAHHITDEKDIGLAKSRVFAELNYYDNKLCGN